MSNGPGEVLGWVKPAVAALRRAWQDDRDGPLRVSVVLAPCPHASGQESRVAADLPGVDRCSPPEDLLGLLVSGRERHRWPWRRKGAAIALGWRLSYSSLVYAETDVRWPWLTAYALRTRPQLDAVQQSLQHRCQVVGDLFMDAVTDVADDRGGMDEKNSDKLFVALLPGSKAAKLVLGVPFFASVASALKRRLGDKVDFALALAPTVTLDSLRTYGDPASNQLIGKLGWLASSIVANEDEAVWEPEGSEVRAAIWSGSSAYPLYKRCTLCLTTVGTNTAELGALGVPMIVVLPTQALHVFRGATGGVAGLLASIPGPLGDSFAALTNRALLSAAGHLAWPNRQVACEWAGREVVPELVGAITPEDVADLAVDYLENPQKLHAMRQELQELQRSRSGSGSRSDSRRGDETELASGAADRLAEQLLLLLAGGRTTAQKVVL
eukprot:jgi/Chlat1/4345/Chrsp29S00348